MIAPADRRRSLDDAVREHVQAGDHLCFASTPSRSNAGILAVARRYAGADPGFTISMTGFHSAAHLLPLLRLGRKYVACFFGDQYPAPRPNPLYTRIVDEGAELEFWSLGAYVTAFRAAALGHRWGVTTSLAHSDIGAALAAAGRYAELPDPAGGRRVGVVAARAPDVTFVHAPLADAGGRVLFSPPLCEGMWSSYAARRGVIVTVEQIVPRERLASLPGHLLLAPDRVLAVCEAPFGAHPQPLYTVPALGAPSYRDDFEHFEWWRRLGEDPRALEELRRAVLDAPDGVAAYRAWVGEARLAALGRPAPSVPAPAPRDGPCSTEERMVLLAAREIPRRLRAGALCRILAGIGQSFLAGALACRWARNIGLEVEVIVETGLLDVDAAGGLDPFLLAHRNVAAAGRLTSVDDALLTQACGVNGRCLAAIGAAQVDPRGAVNSTRLASGRVLTGPGGANDVASSAAEVIVLCPCDPARLVARVDHVTSPGHRVVAVVTDRGTLARDPEGRWVLGDVIDVDGGGDLAAARDAFLARCPWPDLDAANARLAPPFTAAERAAYAAVRAGSPCT